MENYKALMVVGMMVLLVGLGSCASLSVLPSSLDFDLVVGEEDCLRSGVRSSSYGGELVSSLDGDFSGVDVSYSPHGVESFGGYESVEVCVRGVEAGSWDGSLIFETVSEKGVDVGAGVRLKVEVREDEKVEKIENRNQIIEDEEDEFVGAGITGGVVGSGVKSFGIGFLVFLVLVVLVFFVFRG